MNNIHTSNFRKKYIDFIKKKIKKHEKKIEFNSNPYIKSLGDYPINQFPQFIDSNEIEQLKICTSTLPRLLLKLIFNKLKQSDSIFFEMTGFNESCIRKSINKNILDTLCYRADLILTDSGFKVVELNVATNLGGWDIRFHEEAFMKSTTIKGFIKENDIRIKCRDPLINYVKMLNSSVKSLDTYQEESKQTIAIVSPNYDTISADFIISILNNINESQEGNMNFIFINSVDEIVYDHDQGCINGDIIHGIIFPTRTWEKGDRNFTEEILNLWWSNKIILPENPISITMGDKRVLSLLWQERNNNEYSDKEVKIIEKFLPRSSTLNNCPLSLLETIDKKDNFVLKPGIGLQGKQVLVGKYASKKQWKDTISSEYGKSDFLLQSFESSVPIIADDSGDISSYQGVWGAFSFGLQYSGVWIRMSLDNSSYDGVINSALGATESIVFEVIK